MDATKNESDIPEKDKPIEVTPEMIDEGISAFDSLNGVVGEAYLVEQIYIAMARKDVP